jgi:hypothetical protein
MPGSWTVDIPASSILSICVGGNLYSAIDSSTFCKIMPLLDRNSEIFLTLVASGFLTCCRIFPQEVTQPAICPAVRLYLLKLSDFVFFFCELKNYAMQLH